MKPECTRCPVLSNSLFRNFSSDQVSRFVCIFRHTQLRRNQILFFEGGSARELFALRSGLVKMVKPLENGKERIIRVIFPGVIFGLEALTETAYSVAAVVIQDSEICTVSREDFFGFLQANPDISLNMIRFLVGEVAQARAEISDMSFKDARTRVATFLLSMVPPNPIKSASPSVLTLPFSSQEIGDILELSPETVSRTWGALQRDGVIEKRGRKLVIHDVDKLENATRR